MSLSGGLPGKQRLNDSVTLFLSGDVMTGRGIDQILPHPSLPEIHESYITSAKDYVKLASQKNGPIPVPVDYHYIWGDALAVLDSIDPDLRLINLETAVTSSNRYWPAKGIHYRMHPKNFPCIEMAKIDGCILANNHSLDWGYEGFDETLNTIESSGIRIIGAGRNRRQAEAPVGFELNTGRRVFVLAFAHPSSGVPHRWQAGDNRAGVNVKFELNQAEILSIAQQVEAIKKAGDLVVVSVHWGGNWGYQIASQQRAFAHALIDHAGVDIVHGHSSHHPRAIEIYRRRPIFYGCGDLINDYEGIRQYRKLRVDLVLMYFPTMDAVTGELLRLEMVPMQIKRFKLQRPSDRDRKWMLQIMNRECRHFGAAVRENNQRHFVLDWQ